MESSKYFKSVLKGIFESLIITFVGIVILSLLMSKLVFSKDIFRIIYVIISLLGLAIGTIIAARHNGCKGYLVGIGVGCGYFLVTFIVGGIAAHNVSLSAGGFIRFIAMLAVAILSGMIGINANN